MVQSIQSELAMLRRMSPAQLRDKYLEVFGEATRTGKKDFLFKRVAWRLQSLAEGSLSERAKQRAAELDRDADIRMTMPRMPKVTEVGAMAGGQSSLKPAPPPGSQRLP
jgi:hypothetical protein